MAGQVTAAGSGGSLSPFHPEAHARHKDCTLLFVRVTQVVSYFFVNKQLCNLFYVHISRYTSRRGSTALTTGPTNTPAFRSQVFSRDSAFELKYPCRDVRNLISNIRTKMQNTSVH